MITGSAITKAAKDAAAAKRMVQLAGTGGLRLRAYPTGRRVWYVAMRDSLGAPRSYQLGEFPRLGIAEARQAAVDMRHNVKREKADPVADAKARRAIGTEARAGIGTLRAILELYEKDAPSSWVKARPRVHNVFADLLDKAGALLTRQDFQIAADQFMPRKSAHFAVRSVRPALKWGEQRGYLSEGVSRLQAQQTAVRDRVLSESELGAVINALDLKQPHHRAMRFLMWTLARLTEACEATWREIDLDAGVWTLASDRTKNKSTHKLHLPKQAVAMLKSMKPANAKPDALLFQTRAGTPLGSNWDRVAKQLMETSGTSGWHRHDLRRTGATLLGEAGVMPSIIEAALNHKTVHSAIASVYNQARYAPEVGAALQMLADKQDAIAAKAAKDTKGQQGK